MGLRESLSSYSLRFVDWLEKIVEPDPKDRYPDAEAAFAAFRFIFLIKSPILMITGLLIVLIPTTSVLLYPIIKQKKLVSKYRDLEEGLIKP